MSENIRFRVHTLESNISELDEIEMETNSNFSQELIYQIYDNNTTTTNLLRLLSMTSMLGPIFTHADPIFTHADPIEIAIQNSTEDKDLYRNADVSVIINSQNYDTTEKKYEECSICTEKYESNEMVSVLDCGHVYHPKCIKEWGHYNPSCPLCKTKIPVFRKYLAR